MVRDVRRKSSGRGHGEFESANASRGYCGAQDPFRFGALTCGVCSRKWSIISDRPTKRYGFNTALDQVDEVL